MSRIGVLIGPILGVLCLGIGLFFVIRCAERLDELLSPPPTNVDWNMEIDRLVYQTGDDNGNGYLWRVRKSDRFKSFEEWLDFGRKIPNIEDRLLALLKLEPDVVREYYIVRCLFFSAEKQASRPLSIVYS